MYILTGVLFGVAIICGSAGWWASSMVFAILTVVCFKAAQEWEKPNG